MKAYAKLSWMKVSESYIRRGGLQHIACGKMQTFNLQDLGLFWIRKNNDTQTMQKTIENFTIN